MDAERARFARLRELFHAAVELAPAAQEEFIGRLEPADRPLAAELAALLAAQREGGDPIGGALAPELSAMARVPGGAWIGRRVGAWRIAASIAEGGMGAVFLAERADGVVRQRAALKIVRSSRPSAVLVQRFAAERQALATLEHPAIARLLDAGATADDLPYLVMEYVDGVDIERYAHEHALGIDARLELYLSVCAAVEHAHRRLIVHRDIKPSNILVTDDGQVKLLDFGVAKVLAAEDDGARHDLTEAGSSAMTPPFASPEQVTGGTITTATDVYALGVLLYRLLTGRHPYDIDTRSLAAIARTICEVEPKAPSAAALARGERGGAAAGAHPPPLPARRLARDLAGDLDTIVLTALRKEPERRYQSVAALADDIERHRTGRPVLARGDSMAYRTGAFLRRHRVAAAAVTLAVGALLAGTAVALRQAERARSERDRALAAARREAELSGFLRSLLTAADPVHGEGRSVTVASLLERASQRLGHDLTGQPTVEAALRETLGETYRNLGLARDAERELRLALLLREAAGDGRTAARTRMLLAGALRDQARLDEAERELRAALAVMREDEPTFDMAQALDALLVTLRQQGRHREAIAVGQEAVELLRSRFPGQPMALASALNNLALCLGEESRLGEAEALHREAVAAARAAGGGRHPSTAEAVANLASVLDMQGRLGEAVPLYREALDVQREVLGERHPDYLRTLTSLANLLWLGKRPAEAEPLARHAMEGASAALGAGHPLAAYAENILGQALLDLNRPAEAEPYIRSALAKRRSTLPAGHWLIASAQSNLGAALMAQGRLDEAEAELHAAHATLLADRGPEHEKTLLTAERLARLEARRPARH